MSKLEMTQAQVCGWISTHPVLPHQKTKR